LARWRDDDIDACIVAMLAIPGIGIFEAITGADVSTSIKHAKAAMIRRPRERRMRCKERHMAGT
jgi:hypothetical protein